MHSTISYASLALAMGLTTFNANASPLAGSPGACFSPGNPMMQYSVSSTQTNQAGPPVTGDSSCSGNSNCQIQVGQTYSVGVTVEVGIDLGLDFEEIGASAGLSGSVSYSTEQGTAENIQSSCPDGPWTCALIVTPVVTTVSGTQTPLDSVCVPETSNAKPYTVSMPAKNQDGSLMQGHIDVCACKNWPHWADNGAPSIVCPQDCHPDPPPGTTK